MNREAELEEQTILNVLEALESGPDAWGRPRVRSEEAAETLERLYTEVLGLIPLELDPVAPRPELRARILELATADETQEMGGAAAAPVPAVPEQRSRQAAPSAPPAPMAPPRARAPWRGNRASRWPLALAATLALALAGLSLWLYAERQRQAETIASLRQELEQVQQQSAEQSAQLARLNEELGEIHGNLRLVTTPAVEVSPMRPAGLQPLQPDARGTLFVAADHQHWYLSLHNLEPSGEGRSYQLWFVADQGAVSGGIFDAVPGEPLNLSSEHMPPGTKAVLITLEPDAGAPAPSGPEVLRAAPPVQIL